ncbi:N-6 DNA methylase [Vibrio sp. 1180_3]|uniref:N-6 DNA methylase n=1 Tax=Vibrio sp. 1180_3 TaxID=2528832 RepID=UPI0024063C8D|nr:N-6 DNA methylase [Vibrio sp. 1180_3]MDF9399090.1 hypothetical protein [Vibrio sp. 1180_3]
MNSTSIFSFLNPLTKRAQPAFDLAKSYIDRLINAVSLTSKIEEQGRTATTEEIAILNGFFGYGKAAKAFESGHDRNNDLKNAFGSEQEFNTAKKGVLHSYFTPDFIVTALWRSVCRLGLTEGRVLEPSCGSGQFIKLANPFFTGRFVGVELDPTVGKIARLTNPEAKIYINQRLEHAKLPNAGQFNLVISNPPFGAFKAHDQRFGKQSIHNYFILRGLSELEEGGLLAYVVSTWVMDKKNNETRSQIAEMADLVAAVRLPNSAFKTESVNLPVDILIFQKNRNANTAPTWLNVGNHSSGASINQFFIDNPEHVIGQISTPNPFSFNSCEIAFDGDDLEAELNAALDNQTKKPCYRKTAKSLNVSSDIVDITPATDVAIYELFSEYHNVYQRVQNTLDDNGKETAVYKELGFKNKGQERRALAYIDVKDALKELLEAEQANESSVKLSQLRETLNLLHNGFVAAYGALSRTSNKTVLSQCSMYLRVKALEVDYVAPNAKESVKESYNKAAILTKRVFKPFTPVEHTNTYEEAISVCLNESGDVSMDRIAELMAVTTVEARNHCEENNLTFIDPESGRDVDSTQYLCGNVRQKLAAAIAKNNVDYQRNITALEQVIPDDLSAEDITVSLGANWVPEKYYQEFANNLMGKTASFIVTYQAERWLVKAGGYGYYGASNTTWGTDKRSFDQLLESAMNGTPITITYLDSDGKKVVNQEATAEANTKLEEITNEFNEWIWSGAKRREELTRIYNETYNSFVVPDYSEISKNLTLEGCSMTPFDYQKSAILRGVQNSNVLFDCCVGSGKTLILQGVFSILKRLYGSAERPVITMPNALVAQFSNSMSSTFPAANVITLESELSAEKRESILNTAVTTDFDLLIIPESTFGALETPKETEMELIREEIANLRLSLDECEDKNFNIKQIENRIEKRELELEQIMNKPRLNSITWEDLNITTLAVDEIQIFKNQPYSTTYSNVRGMGTAKGSKKAWDFFVKARHLQKIGGRVLGGTGSSLSNSITEAVTWLKVFAPELEYTGLHRVDAFIRQFSAPVTEYSLAATGRTLKSTTTLKRFQNLSELLSIYRTFAEVLSSEQLAERLPRLADGRPALPPLKNGKITNIILPISQEQDDEFERIVIDAQHIDRKKNNMLAIIDRARKTSLDIRHIQPQASNPNNVVNAICEKVVAINEQVKHFNGTQLIFSDRSCPSRHKSSELKSFKILMDKAASGNEEAQKEVESYGDAQSIENMLANSFSIYDEIERILTTEHGLKVAIVHDYKTDIQKTKLKADFNAGKIQVLLGSTSKLGTGWNLNERLVAEHHADLPLRPGDLQQRIGRIIRQQNLAYINHWISEVEVITYSTERTLDSWFAALLDRKARFIAQFNNGTLDTREYEAENEQIDFATLSALVSGDSRLLELVRSQQELKRLSLLKRSYKQKIFRLEDDKNYQENNINYMTNNMQNFEHDAATMSSLTTNDATYKGQALNHNIDKFNQQIKELIKSSYRYSKGFSITLLSIGEFEVTATRQYFSSWEVEIKGKANHYVCEFGSFENSTGRKVLNRIFESMDNVSNCHTKAIQKIKNSNAQLLVINNELKKPFKYELDIVSLKQNINALEKELANEKQAA